MFLELLEHPFFNLVEHFFEKSMILENVFWYFFDFFRKISVIWKKLDIFSQEKVEIRWENVENRREKVEFSLKSGYFFKNSWVFQNFWNFFLDFFRKNLIFFINLSRFPPRKGGILYNKSEISMRKSGIFTKIYNILLKMWIFIKNSWFFQKFSGDFYIFHENLNFFSIFRCFLQENVEFHEVKVEFWWEKVEFWCKKLEFWRKYMIFRWKCESFWQILDLKKKFMWFLLFP